MPEGERVDAVVRFIFRRTVVEKASDKSALELLAVFGGQRVNVRIRHIGQ